MDFKILGGGERQRGGIEFSGGSSNLGGNYVKIVHDIKIHVNVSVQMIHCIVFMSVCVSKNECKYLFMS